MPPDSVRGVGGSPDETVGRRWLVIEASSHLMPADMGAPSHRGRAFEVMPVSEHEAALTAERERANRLEKALEFIRIEDEEVPPLHQGDWGEVARAALEGTPE